MRLLSCLHEETGPPPNNAGACPPRNDADVCTEEVHRLLWQKCHSPEKTLRTLRDIKDHLVIEARAPTSYRQADKTTPADAWVPKWQEGFPCFSNTGPGTTATHYRARLAAAQNTTTSSKLKERMTLFIITEQWGMRQENGSQALRMELGSVGTSPNPHTARTRTGAKTHSEAKRDFYKVHPQKLTYFTVRRALRSVLLAWLLLTTQSSNKLNYHIAKPREDHKRQIRGENIARKWQVEAKEWQGIARIFFKQ